NGGGGGNGGTTAVAIPGCTTDIAPGKQLHVHSAMVQLNGKPFGVAVTPDGHDSFVTLGDSIAVLKNGAGLAPQPAQTIPAAGAKKGMAFTPNGQFMVAAADPGATVIDVAQAEAGSTTPIRGSLTSPNGRGAIGVAISPDSKFAFVIFQSSQNMGVFRLQAALTHGFSPADFVGYVPFNLQPVGIASSKDHNWLYVTGIEPGNSDNPGQGELYAVSVHRAESHPSASAIRHRTSAGCSPARVVTSADGKYLWVTTRQSDSLLGFSAAKLLTDPGHALIARVAVGANPIGLTLASHGDRIVVADSNLNNIGTSNLAVVDVAKALHHDKGALLGYIGSGTTPRQFAVEPGGQTLLVTDNGSGQLQAIRVADLP
ncbi:MAG TPA: hypothetical protein VF979_00835, partial [Streptosporangiaceae bacterium]